MDIPFGSKSDVLSAVALMTILVLSVGSTAFASSGLARDSGKALLAEHHKPDHDKGNGNGPFAGEKDKGNSQGNGQSDKVKVSMFQPVPTSLENFELSAEGIALTKRDGRDGPFTDAEVNLRASVVRHEGNHLRFLATGTVELEDNGEYDIVDAQGIVIFFKNPRGKSVAGLMHIVGKHAIDGEGNDLGKFRLRALVMDHPEKGEWRIAVFPAGKLGHNIMLVNMGGTITGIPGGAPPAPGIASLHHFVVSTVPSPVAAGSRINVTVTAHMSNGTLLKSYEDKAKISDGTGTVTPVITPRFQDGVFKGTLNITKSAASDKLRFTDVETGRTGESNSFLVNPGPLSKVELAPSDVSLNPSGKAQFTAKGTDKFGNELSGLIFVWALTSQDYGSISTAGSKANFTASSSISTSVKLNLTASAGGKSDKSQITISPPSSQVLDHFVIGNVSSPQTAGVPFQITVRAANSTGATITSYSGPMLMTDSAGTLNVTITSGFVNGVWTGNANITKTGDETRITASDLASPSKRGSSNRFEVVAGSLHHFELGPIANQTAGVQFNIIVKAEDAFGNLKTDYQGNVTLGTNNGASPQGNVTVFAPAWYNFTSIDEGQHTFAATMYNARQDVTVTAAGSGKSGISNEFDIIAAAVDTVRVSPTSVTVGPGGVATFSAQAFDTYGNAVTGADFQWSLNSDSLGDIDETSISAAEFTASSVITATTAGTVSAKAGSAEGSASIIVEV